MPSRFAGTTMQSIIGRFFGFDRLLGPVLVKIVYYFGAGVIVVSVVFALITALIPLRSEACW